MDNNEIKLTTDEQGQIKIKLKPGIYNYKEIEAPNGYKLNGNVYTVNIKEDGTVVFENETYGIIYDDKNEIVIPPSEDDNDDKNEIVTPPSGDKENVVIKRPNNIVNSDVKNGSLPYAGTNKIILIVVIISVLASAYLGIKYRNINE